MTSKDHPHSRSGPESTVGARAGAHGLDPNAVPPTATQEARPLGDPLPMEPGQEYVAKGDHDQVVEQLTGERDAMRNDLQRIAADFENFKRRSALAREQASAAAESRLLGELLTVIDDTERAIDHAGKDDTDKASVIEGLDTVRKRLTTLVASHGLERIDTVGSTFDPHLHEAMMVQPGPNGEADDSILQELQSGWKLGDRVLRHARVIVAGGG
jgi:molecular chaperone GrpE